jgi:spermidine synthase
MTVTLLSVLLIGSGAAALVYQVLWLRMLSLTFGVTMYAASIVLASFMGGLAVGSYFAGRIVDRIRSPLRLFGIVEILVGVCALATPALLRLTEWAYVSTFSDMPDSFVIATLARCVLAFSVLIVPTALMGATMPVVLRAASPDERVGASAAVLYASNTTGAIAGAVLAGFYLIPTLGLSQSIRLAASVNAIVGIIALVMSVMVRPRPAARATAAAESDTERAPLIEARFVLAMFIASGFAALALEVVWFRVLVIFLQPTSYAFTVMLAAVLAGIALGSALVSPLMRLRVNWWHVVAALQMAAGVVALRSLTTLGQTPRPGATVRSIFEHLGIPALAPLWTVSAPAILPTAVLLGVAFPIGLRLYAGMAHGEVGSRSGLFYSLNVLGGIAGSIAAGFVLLPQVGSRVALMTIAAVLFVSGLALQVRLATRRPLVLGVSAAAIAVFVLQAANVPDPLEVARRRVLGSRPVLWQDEGLQTTVVVTGGAVGEGERVLYLDGRHQASDVPAMVFVHRRIGLLPAVLHGQPRRALVVGLGGGATAGALSQYPGLQVDVAELSDGVMQASAFFSHVNFDVLRNPAVTLRVDDGRNILLRSKTKYDVITADAIPPFLAGANNLNSVEYFRLVRQALAADGTCLHWNGGGSGTDHKLILRAFVDAFPHVTLWGDGTLMVGSMQPLVLSKARIEALLANEQTARMLALMNVRTFDHLVRMFRAGPAAIQQYLGDTPPLSDDRPLLEYYATRQTEELNTLQLERDPTGLVVP